MVKSNFGGSGAHSSTTPHYIEKAKKVSFFRDDAKDLVLSPEEVEQYFSGHEIECLECGRWFKGLARHISMHMMDADEYKKKHGIPLNRGLVSENTSGKISENQLRIVGELSSGDKVPVICPDCKCEHYVSPLVRCRTNVSCEPCRNKKRREATRRSQRKAGKERVCTFCKEKFIAEGATLKRIDSGGDGFCSRICNSRKQSEIRTGQKMIREKECAGCKKIFSPKRSKLKYCTRECYVNDLSDPAIKARMIEGAKKGGAIRANGKRDENGKFAKKQLNKD